MSKGSKRRPGAAGAYEAGWERVFGRSAKPETCGARDGCANPAEEPHTCPYAEEINNDSEKTCTCCAACQRECAMDI